MIEGSPKFFDPSSHPDSHPSPHPLANKGLSPPLLFLPLKYSVTVITYA